MRAGCTRLDLSLPLPVDGGPGAPGGPGDREPRPDAPTEPLHGAEDASPTRAARATADAQRLEDAGSLVEVFDLVKAVVERELAKSRGGIMLGLSDLGAGPGQFLGGYFPVGSNIIVLNRTVLRHIRMTSPEHEHAYAFHVLLHEYLHTLGYFSEEQVRPMAHDISVRALGADHPATLIAGAMAGRRDLPEAMDLFKRLAHPEYGWFPPEHPPIHIVKGFDLGATPYIW